MTQVICGPQLLHRIVATPKKKRSDNTSGVKGVSWDSSRRKWRARIKINGKTKLIGRFNDINDAELAIRKARNEVHGEFARM